MEIDEAEGRLTTSASLKLGSPHTSSLIGCRLSEKMTSPGIEPGSQHLETPRASHRLTLESQHLCVALTLRQGVFHLIDERRFQIWTYR
jgi:hypothetical protein